MGLPVGFCRQEKPSQRFGCRIRHEVRQLRFNSRARYRATCRSLQIRERPSQHFGCQISYWVRQHTNRQRYFPLFRPVVCKPLYEQDSWNRISSSSNLTLSLKLGEKGVHKLAHYVVVWSKTRPSRLYFPKCSDHDPNNLLNKVSFTVLFDKNRNRHNRLTWILQQQTNFFWQILHIKK